MANVAISGDTSGAVTLTVPATAGTQTVTFPAATGTAMVSGNMPAFSAYRATSNQSFSSGAWTKMQWNAEYFDTANCFDSTTNYRFTPNVAGYYLLMTNPLISVSGSYSESYTQIYKNGSGTNQYSIFTIGSSTVTNISPTIQSIVYANGTTDYFEIYVYAVATSPTMAYGGGVFSGSLIRAA
jgi:hypothetical protein